MGIRRGVILNLVKLTVKPAYHKSQSRHWWTITLPVGLLYEDSSWTPGPFQAYCMGYCPLCSHLYTTSVVTLFLLSLGGSQHAGSWGCLNRILRLLERLPPIFPSRSCGPFPKLDTHSCVLGLMHPPFAVAALGRVSIPCCRNNWAQHLKKPCSSKQRPEH